MEPGADREPQVKNWPSLIDRLGPLLRDAKPEDRVPAFLEEIRAAFGWAVAEYWVLGTDGGYRISHESHADTEALNRFERESANIVVPNASVMERWRLEPTVTESVASRVFWSSKAPITNASFRGGLMREAGLLTQVALPVPNRGYLQQIVMLFDTERRPANVEEMNGLAIATYLKGWMGKWEPEEVPEKVSEPPTGTFLDEQSRRLIGPLGATRLTVCEWELLSLLSEPSRAISFKELRRHVWQAPAEYVGRAVIYDVIARLRRQLRAVGSSSRLTSIPRFGYSLEGLLVRPREPEVPGEEIAPLPQTLKPNGYNLSGRQNEVLQLLADGLTDKEIAFRMSVSRFTVNMHVRAIMERLGVRSRTEAAVKAIRQGLID